MPTVQKYGRGQSLRAISAKHVVVTIALTLVVSLSLLAPRAAMAQDPSILYRDLLRHDGIALLDTLALSPILYKTGYNLNYFEDKSMPGFDELFAAYGSGVFSHMWYAPNGDPFQDSTFELVFKIDEKIVCRGTAKELFNGGCDLMSNALAYRTSGAWRIDLQIPYHTMFRISQRIKNTVPNPDTFWAVMFRQLPSSVLPSWKSAAEEPMATTIGTVHQRATSKNPVLPSTTLDTTQAALVLAPQTTTTIAELDGPGTIYRLYIDLDKRDTLTLDSLRVRITWNNDIQPAVDVPFGDLFNAGAGCNDDSTYFTSAPRSGYFRLAFPMPFRDHARITITSTSDEAVKATVKVVWKQGPIDPTAGHFHAQFTESKRTSQFKQHVAATIRGQGRFIGTHFATRQLLRSPSWLEGDVFMYADNNTNAKLQYWGIEDYYNGGWFFPQGAFALPFAGCPIRFSTLYRYNVLDAVPFNTSFRATFGHGCKDDFPNAPRILVLYYLRHQQFDIGCDTVRAGVPLRVRFYTDSTKSIARFTLDATQLANVPIHGRSFIDTTLVIPGSTSVGDHELRYNGEAWRAPLTVVHSPIFRRLDPAPVRPLRAGSTFPIAVAGCLPKEDVVLKVVGSSTLVTTTASVDGTVHATCRVPDFNVGAYQLSIVTPSVIAVSKDSLHITKTINLEIEELPSIDSSEHELIFYTGFRPEPFWSEGQYRRLDPPTQRSRMTVVVPVGGTGLYKLDLWGARGPDMGMYDIFLDGERVHAEDLYADTTREYQVRGVIWHRDTIRLTRGFHELSFDCIGRNERAARNMLVVDNVELTPIGNTVDVIEQPDVNTNVAYPMPTHAGGTVSMLLISEPTSIVLVDHLGATHALNFTITSTGATATLPSHLAHGAYTLRCKGPTGSTTSMRIVITP